jgi:hypothetical protein
VDKDFVGAIWSGVTHMWGLESTTPAYFLTLRRENGRVACIMESDDS